MNNILGQLLCAEGSEIYLKEVSAYLDVSEETYQSFWDISIRARSMKQIAMGYKPEGMCLEDASELILNPPNKAQKRHWKRGDVIIVVSVD